VLGKGTCSLSDMEGKANVFAFVSMGADRKANTRGGGALELGDSRLFQDGSERGGALGSDVVVIEATKHGGGWGGERRGASKACQWALTGKQTLGSGGALERGHGAPLEALAQDGDALCSVGAVAVLQATKLVVGQPGKGTRSVYRC